MDIRTFSSLPRRKAMTVDYTKQMNKHANGYIYIYIYTVALVFGISASMFMTKELQLLFYHCDIYSLPSFFSTKLAIVKYNDF